MTDPTLPEGFIIRPPTPDDQPGIVALIVACDIADELGESSFDGEELVAEWQKPGFDPQTDVWVAVAPDGMIAGYEELWNQRSHARLLGDGYVHPRCRGLGIGTALLRRLEQRAQEHLALAAPDLKVFIRNGVNAADVSSLELHENEGYQAVRHFYRMLIEMDAPPPASEWPASISLREFRPGLDDRKVFDANEEAFRDHWGFIPWNFEHWKQRRLLGTEKFDASLWFIAYAGDEIAGTALCRMKEDMGWVDQLAVRRPWRRNGLGMALLNHAFGEFHRRGQPRVGLGADATNPTGATRLYERAGMHPYFRAIAYDKVLREGREEIDAENGSG